MPKSSSPNARDHYVYVFHANGYPFYVGHGHAGRLSDRPVFVDRRVRLHPSYDFVKWTLHGRVISRCFGHRRFHRLVDRPKNHRISLI